MVQGPAILRSGVSIANKVTRSLNFQALVPYKRLISTGGYGPVYAAPVNLHAIVDLNAVQVRTRSGELTMTRSIVTLLDVAEVVTATGGNGIGNDDLFTMSDGDRPILHLAGFVDAGTLQPIATTVNLG